MKNNLKNPMTERRYTAQEFANLIGVSIATLNRWSNKGTLIPYKTITNRRYYTDDHLRLYYGR